MTARAAAPDRTWDPIRFQRGTRGFAAFVTTINGLIVLAFGAVVAPQSGVGMPLAAWLSIIGIAAGLAHLVAVYGLIRGRRWSGSLRRLPRRRRHRRVGLLDPHDRPCR